MNFNYPLNFSNFLENVGSKSYNLKLLGIPYDPIQFAEIKLDSSFIGNKQRLRQNNCGNQQAPISVANIVNFGLQGLIKTLTSDKIPNQHMGVDNI